MALNMSTEVWVLVGVAAFFILLATAGAKPLGIGKGGKKWAVGLAVASILGAAFFAGGFGASLAAAPTTAQTARYSVTPSEDTEQSQVVLDDATNTVQVNLQYDISDANFITGTGFAEVNFTIGRTDTSTADATTAADMGQIAEISDDDGSGKTYPCVSKNADGTYKWSWEKGPNAAPATTNAHATVLVEGGGTNFLRVNVTFNPTAFGEAVVYSSQKSTFTVAGESWTLLTVLVVKQA